MVGSAGTLAESFLKYELSVRKEAEADLAAARDWYENQVPGLGNRLIEAVRIAFESIVTAQLSFAIDYDSYRAAFVSIFPYVI